MENIEFKNLIYVLFAIIWFIVSLYANKQTKKKLDTKTKKKTQPTKPTFFDEISEEIKKSIEAEKKAKSNSAQKQRNVALQNTQQIPEEVLMAEKRKLEREQAKNKEKEKQQSTAQNQQILTDAGYFQHDDLQKMVIFTEIFKRPIF